MTSLEQLCLTCGLCCDGTLFDGVQLESGEDPHALRQLGLPVKVSRAQNAVARISQPCAALGPGCACRLYAERPRQCRAFECKLYQQRRDGEVPAEFALGLVRKARRLADRARRLLRRLGDTDEWRGLGERFHRMDERLKANGSDKAALALYADLSLVMHRLQLLAHERFYTYRETRKGSVR